VERVTLGLEGARVTFSVAGVFSVASVLLPVLELGATIHASSSASVAKHIPCFIPPAEHGVELKPSFFAAVASNGSLSTSLPGLP
jgi:hypothetical protein